MSENTKVYIVIEHLADSKHVSVTIENRDNLDDNDVAVMTADSMMSVFDSFLFDTEGALNEEEIGEQELRYMIPRGEA